MSAIYGYSTSKGYVDELRELSAPIGQFIDDRISKLASYWKYQPMYITATGAKKPIPQQYSRMIKTLLVNWKECIYSHEAEHLIRQVIEYKQASVYAYTIYDLHNDLDEIRIQPYRIDLFESYEQRSYTLLKTAITQLHERRPERNKHRNVTIEREPVPRTNAENRGRMQLNINVFNYNLTKLIMQAQDEHHEDSLKRILKDQMYGTTNCTGISQYNLALLRLLGY